MAVDVDHLRQWLGKTESRSDAVTSAPVAALAATLDRDDPFPKPGDPLPPLWSWLYFLPFHRMAETGPDGHPQRGSFIPPIPLPRRMFAGGRLRFPGALRVGDSISRVSRIVDVNYKQGRSGDLVFVLVRHEISNANGMQITEEQDLVYRDESRPGTPAPAPQRAPDHATWKREICPNEVLLFRYSALTFNGHRIHYDRRYATEVEGYPGLVVQGPLIATFLLDLLSRNLPEVTVASFSFRALRPLFDIAPFTVCGHYEDDSKAVKLWAKDAKGWLAMDAAATLG